MSDLNGHPQNPYSSFVVTASAGSGKTFQLSRRFLALVSAGADPARILTITFTRKAASEMSERILADAAQMLRHPETFDDLWQWICQWNKSNQSKNIPKPLPLSDTAKRIIANSGRLQVSTIDSLLYGWQRRYPSDSQTAIEIPTSGTLQLASNAEISRLKDVAWNRCVMKHHQKWMLNPLNRTFAEDHGMHGLRRYVGELYKYSGLIWTNDQLDVSTLIPWQSIRDDDPLHHDNSQWFARAREYFSALMPLLNEGLQEKIGEALRDENWSALWLSKIIAKETLTVSQTFLRGKKRDTVLAQVFALEGLIKSRVNHERFRCLDEVSSFILQAYRDYDREVRRIKALKRTVDFSDLLQSGFELIVDPANVGSRMMIQGSFDHLMLDEFQDTSFLQWRIFSELCEEIMAGRGVNATRAALPGTVFIVGDAKQSIYGFRDADPSILSEAQKAVVSTGGMTAELDESFRSTPEVLEWVNQTFNLCQMEFQPHRTAKTSTGEPRVPSHSYLATLFPTIDDIQELKDRNSQRIFVAKRIAEHLQSLLFGPDNLTIYDKKTKSIRQLQPQDCAILYRAGTATELIEEQLQHREIPVYREESSNFLHFSDVSDCLALIRLSLVRGDRLTLAQVLRSPFVAFTDSDLIQLLETPDDDIWSVLSSRFTPQYRKVSKYLDFFATHQVSSALSMVIEISGYTRLVQQERDESTAKQSSSRMRTLIELIRDLENQGMHSGWEILRALDDLSNGEQSPQSGAPNNAVRMMTIHKSKGLEFPLVIIVGSEENWEKVDTHWTRIQPPNRSAAVFYVGNKPEQPVDDVTFEEIRQELNQSLRRESERLLYVAMTRAQSGLIVASGEPPQTERAADPHAPFVHRLYAAQRQLPYFQDQSALITDLPGQLEMRISQKLDFNIRPLSEPTSESQAIDETLPLPKKFPQAPFGVDIIRPHHLIGAQSESEPDLGDEQESTPQLREQRRLTGTFLHFALQHWLADGSRHPNDLWADFVAIQRLKPSTINELQSVALGEWQKVSEHKIWQDLKRNANKIYCEMPFLRRDGKNLIRGNIDLVALHHDQSCTVFDYKYSSSIAADVREKYRGQLSAYVEAIGELFPDRKITAAIIQLPICEVIPLS